MTFDQAMDFCKKGHKVREATMNKGWTIFYIKSGAAKGYYCLNPVTGSNYAFVSSDYYKTSTKWDIAP